MPLSDTQRRFVVAALILGLGAVSFIDGWVSAPLAMLTVLVAAVRDPFAARLGMVTGAVVVGGVCLGDVAVMSHHRWLLASSLLWLGLPSRDDDAVGLARTQLIAVYVFGALDKVMDGAWCSGARLIQIAAVTHPGPWLFDRATPFLAPFVAAVVVVTEVGLALGLASSRASAAACAVAIIFHGLIELTLDVGVFSALSIVLAVGTRRRSS